MSTHSDLRAFTIVELLVVIAIIAVLAALSISVLGRMKESAHTVTCASNLRQLGVAMTSYSAENNMMLPPYTANTPPSGWKTLNETLRPYTGGGDPLSPISIWECPSQEIKTRPDGKITFAYSGNPILLAKQRDSNGTPAGEVGSLVRIASVGRPSEVFLLIDAGQRSPSGWATSILNNIGAKKTGKIAKADKPWVGKPFTEPDEDLKSGVRYRHNGKANMLFLDGHVAPFAKGEVLERNVVINY